MSNSTPSPPPTSSPSAPPSPELSPDLFSNPAARFHRASLRKAYLEMMVDAGKIGSWDEANDRYLEIVDEELRAAFG